MVNNTKYDKPQSFNELLHIYIHTYMKFITCCIVEDGSNQRRGLLLGGEV